MKKPKKKPLPKRRSPIAAAALHKTGAGAHKHRLEPRKGAKNDQPELLERAEDEIISCLPAHCGALLNGCLFGGLSISPDDGSCECKCLGCKQAQAIANGHCCEDTCGLQVDEHFKVRCDNCSCPCLGCTHASTIDEEDDECEF